MTWRSTLSMISLLTVLSVACSSPAALPQTVSGGAEPRPAQPSLPKVLRIGAQREPDNFLRPGSQGQIRILDLAHASLVVQNEYAQLLPRLATEVPSLERGTWRLNPDGTMDMVWKLHPKARWHDGRPMTADDLVFSYEL